jgi:hypothetical protein
MPVNSAVRAGHHGARKLRAMEGFREAGWRVARAVLVMSLAGAAGAGMAWAALVLVSGLFGVFVPVEQALGGVVLGGSLGAAFAGMRSWRGRSGTRRERGKGRESR